MTHQTSNGHPHDTRHNTPPRERVFDPETTYDRPADIVRDASLRRRDKLAALESWDDVARMRLAATDEGMPANGTTSSDLRTLEEIEAARRIVENTAGSAPDVYRSTHSAHDVLSTQEARHGSPNLMNYRVLFNSLMLAAIAAFLVGALWWIGST